MTDFGRRAGDMYKSVYDPGLLGYVWNSALLDQRTLAQVRAHTPFSHTHTEAQITDLVHDALAIKGVEVDDTDKDNEKILQYNSTSGKLEYETPGVGGAHKATHQDGGADEIDCAGLVGRVNYVDRGDPSTYDYAHTDLTIDNNLHNLDLSSIVPAGATAVHIAVTLDSSNASAFILFIKGGHSNTINRFECRSQVANLIRCESGFVAIGADRIVQYKVKDQPYSILNIIIQGWLI